MQILKSKTMWFAILLAVGGVLEQSEGWITQVVGAGNSGLVMMLISVVVAVLRVVTTTPLNEK